MKGIGGVLLVVGGFVLYNSFQATQTIAFRLANLLGNEAAIHGVQLDMGVGFIMALIGGGLLTRDS